MVFSTNLNYFLKISVFGKHESILEIPLLKIPLVLRLLLRRKSALD